MSISDAFLDNVTFCHDLKITIVWFDAILLLSKCAKQ